MVDDLLKGLQVEKNFFINYSLVWMNPCIYWYSKCGGEPIHV